MSDYETLLSKGGVDSFRISFLKTMAVEIHKILNGMGPKYLSHLFPMSTIPCPFRGDNKLIHPLKRTTTFGIKSLACYGMHLCNISPHDVKWICPNFNFKQFHIYMGMHARVCYALVYERTCACIWIYTCRLCACLLFCMFIHVCIFILPF